MPLDSLQAQTRRLMRAGAEGYARLDVQHRASLRVVVVDPDGADVQTLADRHGLEVRFPVVFPVLVAADSFRQRKGDVFGVQPLTQIRDRFGGVVLRGNVQMDDRFASVLLQQFLVDQVDVRNVARFLLEMTVVLHIDTAARSHTGHVACRVRESCIHGQDDLGKIHKGLHMLGQHSTVAVCGVARIAGYCNTTPQPPAR